jgi:hypothetical protein
MKWTSEFTHEILDREEKFKVEAIASIMEEYPDEAKPALAVSVDYREIGFARWHLFRDIKAFRENLNMETCRALYTFERFEDGESGLGSFVSMLAYQQLFDGLAAGDFVCSSRLAGAMGGRDKIEKYHDTNFTRTMGYALKHVVLESPAPLQRAAIAALRAECEKKRSAAFIGYAMVFDAVLVRDLAAAQAGLVALLNGHRKQSKGNGMFANKEDEALCIWGIGMANLCRWRGLSVDPNDPLIPSALLVPLGSEAGISATTPTLAQ